MATTIKERVKKLLTIAPAVRDDVHLLLSVMWKAELKKMNKDISVMTAHELLELISLGKLSNFKTIDRWWRKWQEECEGLRGLKYDERHHEEDAVVKSLENTHK